MMRLSLHLLALGLLLATAAGAARAAEEPPAAEVAPADGDAKRDAAYRAFRREFDAGHYTEALPEAERVVELTEQLDAHHPDLARALNNLGATQYRLGDYLAAEKSYSRALGLIEEAHGTLSPRLLAPLRGLALTFQASGRNEVAVPLLERAVAISRRAEGLFNPDQKELLVPLADGYVALARWKEADRTHQYLLQIAEHQYGSNDMRMLPALQQLGRWDESTGQRNAARQVWDHLLAIASKSGHPDPVGQIVALRGLAETYRLDYELGPEPAQASVPGQPPMRLEAIEPESVLRPSSMMGPEYMLAPQGEEALSRALAVAEKLEPRSPTVIGVVLVDLGDWALVGGHVERALGYYARALPMLPTETDGPEGKQPGPLTRPSALLYRAPPAATRLRDQPPTVVVEKYAIVEFTVTAEGHVRDAKIVEGDASDTQRSALLSAISRAIYRPRFVDGKPVATERVRFRESFRQLKG